MLKSESCLLILAFTILLSNLSSLLPVYSFSSNPVKFDTIRISFTPPSTLVIIEGQTQIFRAPLCNGESVDGWSFKTKVYLMNVGWDSDKVGDNTWLHIRVSNGPEMMNIVRDNVGDLTPGAGPQPFTKPFTYNRATWGNDDIYVEITASEGSPTFQFGLELTGSLPDKEQNIPDGMNGVEIVSAEDPTLTRDRDIETLEQVTQPFIDVLSSGETGHYKIPFCFEDTYEDRSLTITTRTRETVNEAPGGVASFICTSYMLQDGLCWRSKAIDRGSSFFDTSGAKVISDSPRIPKKEFGPVYLLVLVQGNYKDKVEFSITTKLRNPVAYNLKLTGHSAEHLYSVLKHLKEIEIQEKSQKPDPLSLSLTAESNKQADNNNDREVQVEHKKEL